MIHPPHPQENPFQPTPSISLRPATASSTSSTSFSPSSRRPSFSTPYFYMAAPLRSNAVYDDSFDQPAEPFECDISAILPPGVGLDDDDDDISYTSNEYEDEDDSRDYSLQEQQQNNIHQHHPDHFVAHSDATEPEHRLQDRYLHVSPQWSPALNQAEDQLALEHHLQRHPHSQDHGSPHYLDDDIGGHARLSTIAELSELPSLNYTNSRLPSHRANTLHPSSQKARSSQVVISRDLVLEDLFVEGQDDADDEAQRELLANLKPTDILGPLHETRDFQITSLTAPTNQWDRLEQHHQQQQQQQQLQLQQQQQQEHQHRLLHHEEDLLQEEQELHEQEQYHQQLHQENQDMGSFHGSQDDELDEEALKREYEEMFGSKGAIDSEQSGLDLSGVLGYDDSEMCEEDEDDEDYDEEEDEREEEFYAMLNLNNGNGNMILGNNIPRKPRAIAPPPGSRLPVPGSAIKKAPLTVPPAVSKPPLVSNVPITPKVTLTKTPQAPQASPPVSGIRPPQVSTTGQSGLRPPSIVSRKPMKPSGSILDDLWNEEPAYDLHQEQSPGAIYAAKVAAELKKEEQERASQLRAPSSSKIKAPTKIPTRAMPETDIDTLTKMLKVESVPVTPVETAPPRTFKTLPRPDSPPKRAATPPKRTPSPLRRAASPPRREVTPPRREISPRKSTASSPRNDVGPSKSTPSSPKRSIAPPVSSGSGKAPAARPPLAVPVPASTPAAASSSTSASANGPSSRRSSFGETLGGQSSSSKERLVPTMKESFEHMERIRKQVLNLKEEIHQENPAYQHYSKRGSSSRHHEEDSRHERHGGRAQLGQSDSFQSSAPSSPETKTVATSSRRPTSSSILGKLSRNVLHSSPSSAVSPPQTPRERTTSATRRETAPHSRSHPLQPSQLNLTGQVHHSTPQRHSHQLHQQHSPPQQHRHHQQPPSHQQHRHQQQPPSRLQRVDPYGSSASSRIPVDRFTSPRTPLAARERYVSYEDQNHSGSSGQSVELYDEPGYEGGAAAAAHGYHPHHPYPSSQSAHHLRQGHDGSLILDEHAGPMEGEGCPVQIRPKEVRFSSSVAGKLKSHVTLYNWSRRRMQFEILRPAGITVSPSFGYIQPGREQRLSISLAETRGPGRVMVELDGEWLVPFGVTFD